MFDPVRVPVAVCVRLLLLAFPLVALRLPGAAAQTAPTAHHPGMWTTAAPWPGRSWSNSVWAVHMALTRGDTLFARPSALVLAWGNWSSAPGATDGGAWAWDPRTGVAANAAQNLVAEPVGQPPLNAFCAGHASLASGDLQIVGGTNRNIAGEKSSARFRHQTREWSSQPLQARRWYANATPLADGRLLATAGIRYDHMVVFGGRRQSDGALVSDVQRYAITAGGEWEAALSGSGADWPEPREDHTLAEQPEGPYYLFGGRGTSALLRDFWQLKRSDDDNAQSYTWTKHEWPGAFTGVDRPDPRWRHVAVVDRIPDDVSRSTMYLYGGDDGAPTPTIFGDLWMLDTVLVGVAPKWTWTQLTGGTGTPPGARTGATAVWDESDNRMILFGGRTTGGALAGNDVHVLRVSSGGAPDWRVAPLASGSEGPPSARVLHAMGADFERRQPMGNGGKGNWFHAAIFGGETASGLSNELYELFLEPGTDSVKWI